MIMRTRLLGVCAALAVGAAAAQSDRQHGDAMYTPQVAQPGKDVIWVPTPLEVVERMLRMAETTSGDIVYDLGAGDGKIAITAAKKFGARAIGIEFNPDMAAYAQRNAEREGVAGRATIRRGDIFETDFREATVITLFLLPHLNQKLKPTLLQMRPGTRVVSHAFDMDDWKPDETSKPDGRIAYLWIVPANVQGRWRLDHPLGGRAEAFDIDFMQIYQRVEGEALFENLRVSIDDAWMRGPSIRFALRDARGIRWQFAGRVDGRAWDPLLIVDFPLFERDEKGQLTYVHQPFVAPVEEDLPLLDTEPEKVRGTHYDVVLNGTELGSGSLRNHRSDVQRKILTLMGYGEEKMEQSFGFMLNALDVGAPPHGGFAFGFDRWVMKLAGAESLRDVIPFPKSQRGQDLLMDAPSPVEEAQLDELSLRVRIAPVKS